MGRKRRRLVSRRTGSPSQRRLTGGQSDLGSVAHDGANAPVARHHADVTPLSAGGGGSTPQAQPPGAGLCHPVHGIACCELLQTASLMKMPVAEQSNARRCGNPEFIAPSDDGAAVWAERLAPSAIVIGEFDRSRRIGVEAADHAVGLDRHARSVAPTSRVTTWSIRGWRAIAHALSLVSRVRSSVAPRGVTGDAAQGRRIRRALEVHEDSRTPRGAAGGASTAVELLTRDTSSPAGDHVGRRHSLDVPRVGPRQQALPASTAVQSR